MRATYFDFDAAKLLSIAYPCSAMGCHVSAVPNHQNGCTTPLKMRGVAAMCDSFGYELDLLKLTDAAHRRLPVLQLDKF